jgi:pilus assembly protein TadC
MNLGILCFVVMAAPVGILAAISLRGRGSASRRLAALGVTPLTPREPRRRGPPYLAMVGGVGAGVGLAVLLGGALGVSVGVVGAGLVLLFALRDPFETRRIRAAVVAELPLAIDLLAALLQSGAPTDRAVLQVADAVGGPLGELLRRVGRAVALGSPGAEVWAPFDAIPEASSLVRAATRARDTGAALARACERAADDLRVARTAAAEAHARRKGVLIVLPLGCCFLPAFVLIGVVPVVLGVLQGVMQ